MIKNILIVIFLLQSVVKADFVRDDTLEVVNDTITWLMWQDDVASKTVIKDWAKAIEYCEDLRFAGFDDWRLPNRNELYSIGDKSRFNPAIKTAFSNVGSESYWSSTTDASDPGEAWDVNFDDSSDARFNKYYVQLVRCVRAGQ